MREARITADKITFPATGAVIAALASDYAGAAGSNPTVSIFDELWAFTSEPSRRLWDEMVPPPTRKVACRVTVTYAGFDGESALLDELHKRGLAQPMVGPDLHAGNGLLMFWSHDPIAPWQTPQWIEQMRATMRPNAFLRMIENRFVSTESTFVDMDWWDACVDAEAVPVVADKNLTVWVGVDASVKRDSTALVAVTWDTDASKVRLVAHKVFQPSRTGPLDFEATIEKTVKDWRDRYRVRSVLYDPYQMAAVAQRLSAAGVRMREYPQSVPNLVAMGSNLYELIKGRGIVAYPDEAIRLAVSRTIALETQRGWRLAKEKTSHKIDVVVALAMASLAAVEQGQAAGVLMVAPVIITAPHCDRFGNVLSEADSAFGWATRHGGDGIISF
jgi:phage terminase large subunit-like protein